MSGSFYSLNSKYNSLLAQLADIQSGGLPPPPNQNLSSVLTTGNNAASQNIINLGSVQLKAGGGGAITFQDGTSQNTAFTGVAPTPNLASVLAVGSDAASGSITGLVGIQSPSGTPLSLVGLNGQDINIVAFPQGINPSGTINIQTYDGVANQLFSFDGLSLDIPATGSLSWGGGSKIEEVSGDLELGGGGGNVIIDGDLVLANGAGGSLVFQDGTIQNTAYTGAALPVIRTAQDATNSIIQDQVIDAEGRMTASNIYNGGYGGAVGAQYLPIDPLPKYPLLCGVYQNYINSATLTNWYNYTGYSDNSTLSIRINNLSQYDRFFDPIIVRLNIAFIFSTNSNNSPPFPYNAFGNWSGNVVFYPDCLRVPSTIDASIPVASNNALTKFFDLITNDILTSYTAGVAGYTSTFGLVGGPPFVPQPVFCPQGRSIWAYGIQTDGIDTGNLQLYPFVVDTINDYAILSVVMKNQYVYSGYPQSYNSSITAELVCAGKQAVSNISFIV